MKKALGIPPYGKKMPKNKMTSVHVKPDAMVKREIKTSKQVDKPFKMKGGL